MPQNYISLKKSAQYFEVHNVTLCTTHAIALICMIEEILLYQQGRKLAQLVFECMRGCVIFPFVLRSFLKIERGNFYYLHHNLQHILRVQVLVQVHLRCRWSTIGYHSLLLQEGPAHLHLDCTWALL